MEMGTQLTEKEFQSQIEELMKEGFVPISNPERWAQEYGLPELALDQALEKEDWPVDSPLNESKGEVYILSRE